jgi:hypothetical protein
MDRPEPRTNFGHPVLGLVGVVWASTFLVQVPMHERLSSGRGASAHTRLLMTNWIRTVAWTLRGGLVIYLAKDALR